MKSRRWHWFGEVINVNSKESSSKKANVINVPLSGVIHNLRFEKVVQRTLFKYKFDNLSNYQQATKYCQFVVTWSFYPVLELPHLNSHKAVSPLKILGHFFEFAPCLLSLLRGKDDSLFNPWKILLEV